MMDYIGRYEQLLKRQNIRYVRFGDYILRDYGQIIIPLGPIIQPKPPVKIDTKQVFNKLKGKLVWWSYYDAENINPEWYAIIKRQHTHIADYPSSNTRNQIKKGLKNCEVKPVSAQLMCDEGFDIFRKANAGRGLKSNITKLEYLRIVTINSEFEDIIKYFGIFVGDRMVGYAVIYLYGTTEANISEIRIDPAYNKYYPSYALFQALSEYYLTEKRIDYISDGYKSLSHATNIQTLLVDKFGYEKVNLTFEYRIRPFYQIMIIILYPFRKIISFKPLNAVFNIMGLARAKKKLPK